MLLHATETVIVFAPVFKLSIIEPAAIPIPLNGLPTTRFVKLLTFVIVKLPVEVSAVNVVLDDVETTSVSSRAFIEPVLLVIVVIALPPKVLAIVIALPTLVLT